MYNVHFTIRAGSKAWLEIILIVSASLHAAFLEADLASNLGKENLYGAV